MWVDMAALLGLLPGVDVLELAARLMLFAAERRLRVLASLSSMLITCELLFCGVWGVAGARGISFIRGGVGSREGTVRGRLLASM